MIYDRIKALAKEKGITISRMENDLGLSERNTCKWNKSLPRVDTLKRIADYLGVPMEELLKTDEEVRSR